MPSSINHHTCASTFQDKLYGLGQRVWNKTNKGRRCTVCGAETVVSEAIKAPKADKAAPKK